MHNFVFMLKTYRNDLEYVKRLVDTYSHYNLDKIPLFIVVPDEDKNLFYSCFAELLYGGEVISEKSISVDYAQENIEGISAGYINQEIIKLAFWKLGFCKNYLCLDSEAYFIRDFHVDEFMYDDDIPYTVLIEDRDLKTNPQYYNEYWVEREKRIKIIQEKLQYDSKHLLTCHGFQTFNCRVLENMETEFLIKNQYTYLDLITISPYEFSWYNIWLQKTRIIPIYICEPHFKIYHIPLFQFEAIISNIDEDDLKRGYIGVVLQSNYTGGEISSISDIESLPITLVSNRFLPKIVRVVNKNYLFRIVKNILKIFRC